MGKLLKLSFIENVPFWILAGVSIALGVTAFFMPPKSEIHPSVLKFISWMFAWGALWTVFVAMMRGIDARLTHGKTTLSVGGAGTDTVTDNTNTNYNEEQEE